MNEGIDIRNELKEIAPLLASLPKKNPVEITDSYFETLEESTLIACGINEPAGLKRKSGENPFVVPPGYFENLPEVISAKVAKRIGSTIIRQIGKRWWMAAAAAAAILIVSISILRNQPATLTSDTMVDTTFLLLENAAGLPDAMVVEFYAHDQPEALSDSLQHEYLIEASGLDAETILSL